MNDIIIFFYPNVNLNIFILIDYLNLYREQIFIVHFPLFHFGRFRRKAYKSYTSSKDFVKEKSTAFLGDTFSKNERYKSVRVYFGNNLWQLDIFLLFIS